MRTKTSSRAGARLVREIADGFSRIVEYRYFQFFHLLPGGCGEPVRVAAVEVHGHDFGMILRHFSEEVAIPYFESVVLKGSGKVNDVFKIRDGNFFGKESKDHSEIV